MERLTSEQVTLAITSSRTSNEAEWSRETRSATFAFDLPPLAYATSYTLSCYATQGGSPLTIAGKSIMQGDNTVNIPITEGQEEAETVTLSVVYKSHPNLAWKNNVSTTRLTMTLTVEYEYRITNAVPPAAVSLFATTSTGDPVTLEWYGAANGTENALTGYNVQALDTSGTWYDIGTVSTPETYGSMLVPPPETVGEKRWFRVRAMGEKGETYASAWTMAPEPLLLMPPGAEPHTRMPRLYDRQLGLVKVLQPISVSITDNLKPLSTASMELPLDAEVQPRMFVEFYNKRGSLGVYQIISVRADYGNNTCSVELEHGMTTLSDAIIFEKSDTEKGAITGTFREVVTGMLEYQRAKIGDEPFWAVGRVDVPEHLQAMYEFSNENLLLGLTSLKDQAGSDYVWTFDQRSFPWKLNVLKASDKLCEVRKSRNLTKAVFSVNASEMCTRVYPYGYGEGKDRISLATIQEDGQVYMDADTIGTYGVIERTFTEETIAESSVLKTVAETYLEQHKEPAVSVELDAVDLSALTGEAMDSFTLGTKCRFPLAAYRANVVERIISMRWNDLLGAPDTVTLTLANPAEEASDEIADLVKKNTTSAMIGGRVQVQNDGGGFRVFADEIASKGFNIEVYAAILSITATVIVNDSTHHRVKVDGQQILSSNKHSDTIDILQHLKRDEDGSLSGGHTVSVNFSNDGAGDKKEVSGKIYIVTKYLER